MYPPVIRKYCTLTSMIIVLFMLMTTSLSGHYASTVNVCGNLVQGTECLLFSPEGEPRVLLVLDEYGGFTAGDDVCVTGLLVMDCTTECSDVIGCISDNTITESGSSAEQYDGFGVLIQGTACVLFSHLGQSGLILELDNYEDFQVNDTVYVSGILSFGCTPSCPDADACLEENTIMAYTEAYAPAQAVVRIETGFPIDPFVIGWGGIATDTLAPENTFLVSFPDTIILNIVIDALQGMPGVVYAHPNYVVGIPETYQMSQSFPDENKPVYMLGISPEEFYGDSSAYTINCDSAHLFATGSEVTVAVIDNGLAAGHPLFDGALVSSGYDLVDNDTIPEEMPGNLYGHGTFISGIIKRIAPDCNLLPIRVFDANGNASVFDIANAIYLAIGDSVNVINMSFGMYSHNEILAEAVADAVNAGIAAICASGNDGSTSSVYPAGYPGTIAVSALDSMELIADFSNYGAYIDVSAPGVNIYSSLAGEYEWGTWSGTSFAAPMVSGICALILQDNESDDSLDIEDLIKTSAQRNLLWGSITAPDIQYGYGRADAFRAVQLEHLGDVDHSGDKNLEDILYLINFIYDSGPSPLPLEQVGDMNCSGNINLTDILLLIEHIYLNGPGYNCSAF